MDAGELRPGGAIESEASLTTRYDVARGTVRAALTELAGRGLIVSVPGKGWFVRTADGAVAADLGRDVSAVVEKLRRELHTGGYSAGDPFLSEKDLGERFGLTRYAAKAAFAALEADGLIISVHGRGRFVSGLA